MKRLLPFVVLIILLLAGAAAVPYFLNPERHRAEITRDLSALLHRPVVIGTLSLRYWPPALELGKLAVMSAEGAPALQIEKLLAPLDAAALFRLQFRPVALHLHQWVLTTQRKPDGSWDLQEWLKTDSGVSTQKAWPIQQVLWKEGEVRAVDRFAGVSQELALGRLEGELLLKNNSLKTTGAFVGLGAPAAFSLSATGQFGSSPNWSGDLQWMNEGQSAAFQISRQGESFDIKGGAPRWSYSHALALLKFYSRANAAETASPLMLDHWQFHAHRDAGRVTMEHQSGLAGGVTEIKGRLSSTPSGMLAHIDAAVKDVPAEVVLSVLGENIPLSGKVTALAKDFQLELSSRTTSTLNGQGVFELRDGRYLFPEFSTQKLSKAKTMAYLKKKFPDLQKNGMPIGLMGAHWAAKNGSISVDNGFLLSESLKAGWVGQMNVPRRGFDGTLRLQFSEKNPALAKLIPAKYRTQPAFGRLQGAWQEWFLRAIPVSKIPAHVQAKLRRAVSQK